MIRERSRDYRRATDITLTVKDKVGNEAEFKRALDKLVKERGLFSNYSAFRKQPKKAKV